MYTLKLYTNWLSKAQEKVSVFINGKRKIKSQLSKKQIKGIDNLIKIAKVVKDTDEYTIYAIKT